MIFSENYYGSEIDLYQISSNMYKPNWVLMMESMNQFNSQNK